ncbi:MAG: hypothetical protein ACR5LF_03925 [Symbiopectobacterium sp.]
MPFIDHFQRVSFVRNNQRRMPQLNNGIGTLFMVAGFFKEALAVGKADHQAINHHLFNKLLDIAEPLLIRAGPRDELDPILLRLQGANHAGRHRRFFCRPRLVGGGERIRQAPVVHLP